VLHGEFAVAPLKPGTLGASDLVCDIVLHGEFAVAPLKLRGSGPARRRSAGSPRRICRGPIEARRSRRKISGPVPVLHREFAVAPLKQQLAGVDAKLVQRVLHGEFAVAPLKRLYRGCASCLTSRFSTANLPWPH